ncbi:Eco57I restriction-modification methylase domain-containing protein [Thermoflexibacter ruber]|uniref:site-specific DNA-methyltransferase (adenine-specific) n=1 Tax=Thermoflexibacter ruber TaxID=1003 RepID=A0A1I2J2L9_9BACT|nr:TaqI-like C-terminal specificity domain-containing protein [Thermoflexibacter ruber]SFF48268.1 N-6 DNA Methylase [Thermoflexibacter ruber]
MDSYESILAIDFRKQEGIFYSPNFITNYIITETVKEYLAGQNNTFEALQNIKILDLACGTGAFLIESFDFLLQKYHTLFPDFPQSEKWIIENNLYGVDLDVNAVQICKELLFEKSGFICENIKQGNSLIDEPSIDERAFDWKKEFPKAFVNLSGLADLTGFEGFDLIVGNPPYVSTKLIQESQKKYFLEKYVTAKGQFDLYGLFIEKGQKLLKKGGVLSFITSSTFLSNKDFVDLRRFLFEKTQITQIAYLGETVFDQAAVDVSILIFKNQKAEEHNQIQVFKNRKNFDEDIFHLIRQSRFDLEKNNYEIKLNSEEKDFDLIDKIYENKETLGNILDLPRGIEIGGNSEKITSKYQIGLEKVLVGKNIGRYQINFEETYIQFENDKSIFKELEIYKQPKILIQRIRNLTLKQRIVATLDSEGYLCTNTLRIGILKNENYDLSFILGILNSKLVNFIFSKFFLNKDIYAYQLERIPIPQISLSEQENLAQKVNRLLFLNKQFYQSQKDFLDLITSNFGKDQFTRKLENWYKLDWNELSKELEKSKIKLSLPKQKEWKTFFTEEKAKVMPLDDEIQQLEKEIDNLVYQLYNLTEEEIKIVENG